VCLVALVAMGGFALASAFSPNWIVLAGLRFGAGAGAAFFFAPALGLVASYYPEGRRGPVIGIYNSGFSVGSGMGLIGGALIGVSLGWPWALGVGGAALLLIAGVAAVFLPATATPAVAPSRADVVRAALPVVRSKVLWALALGLTGVWAAGFILAQYTVEFAASAHPSWSVPLAASLPTILIVIEVAGGPIGGWLSERYRAMRRLLLVFTIPSGLAVFLVPFLPFAALVGVFAFVGFALGVVFADLYLLPSFLPGMRPETLAFALALINGIQILLGSALAVGFGFVAVAFGYTVAWGYAGVVAIATLPLLIAATFPGIPRGPDAERSGPPRDPPA
jgi:MFS family permease